jgi:hypothetical protein
MSAHGSPGPLARVALLALACGCSSGARAGEAATPRAGAAAAGPAAPTARAPLPTRPPEVAVAGAPCPAPRRSGAPSVASAPPRILLADAAHRACLAQALAKRTPAAARFAAMVDGHLSGRPVYAFQPWYAALLYQLTGKARYAEFAVRETDAFVASEEALVRGGARARVSGDSYLEAGQIVGNLALVYDWCHDRLTPEQRARWIAYANQAVWNVWNHRSARWGEASHPWTGWGTDNPSNNYYYSFLRATMLLGLATHGENPEAAGWLDLFRNVKLEQELFPTFARDLAGGGSREGTGYGTAMKNLFELYDWWERSTGERIADRTPHALASFAHMIHAIVPTRDRLAPTGDHSRDSRAELFDYHRQYLQILAALYPHERLAGAARALLAASTVRSMQNGFMVYSDFLYDDPGGAPAAPGALAELATTYWAPGTGQLSMRASWEPAATYANFICGPYTESHAHRDQGSFVLYRTAWLAYDANVDSHSGIEQDELNHNLVRIEQGGAPVKQAYGGACRLLALHDDGLATYALADVTPVYKGRAPIRRVERELLYLKPDVLVVFDRVDTDGDARRIWTLNLPGRAEVEGARLTLAAGRSRLDVRRLAPADLPWTVQPPRAEAAEAGGGRSRFLHVLTTGEALAAAERADAPGAIGARLALADGRSVVVRFSSEGRGGTLEVRARDGAVLHDGPLPSSVEPPPLYAR